MFFWNKFCGIIIFFFILINVSYAQYPLQAFPFSKKNSLKNSFLACQTLISNDSKNSLLTFSQTNSAYNLKQEKMILGNRDFNMAIPAAIAGNFVTCDYGFFCRQELKIEKATNIPIHFRLGSLEQCNYYEGKH